jgi:reverse gyrase
VSWYCRRGTEDSERTKQRVSCTACLRELAVSERLADVMHQSGRILAEEHDHPVQHRLVPIGLVE